MPRATRYTYVELGSAYPAEFRPISIGDTLYTPVVSHASEDTMPLGSQLFAASTSDGPAIWLTPILPHLRLFSPTDD